MLNEDVAAVAALQEACFPPPFPTELLWQQEHLYRHLSLFQAGQFVVESDGAIVASASSTRISEQNWLLHRPWADTVGGPMLSTFDPFGSTLYGLDISVHPDYRGQGIAKNLYLARFDLIRRLSLTRFGTACRLPGYLNHATDDPGVTVEEYAALVAIGDIQDRTMTPLLRIGLTFLDVIHNYMDDKESGNSAALMEWNP